MDRPARVVLAIDEFLAIGRLDALVAELQPRQANADQRQEGRAEDRPEDADDDQRVGHLADEGQLRHVRRKPQQDRQEGDERHQRLDEVAAERLGDRREAHRVFLDALRRAFDMPQPRPVVHVVVVHRGPPAEHVVADEEPGQHADGDRHEGDAGKAQQEP